MRMGGLLDGWVSVSLCNCWCNYLLSGYGSKLLTTYSGTVTNYGTTSFIKRDAVE